MSVDPNCAAGHAPVTPFELKGLSTGLAVVAPFDRERDRSIAENAEVVTVVRIFPDVLAIDDDVLS